LPFISIGNRSLSEFGQDAFNTEGSPLGKYYKTMRDKVGLHFYQMIYFHYRTSNVFGSKASIQFVIESSGYVRDIKKLSSSGDPMFSEYCKTVIQNAAPFAPMDESMRPYLEEGVLNMNVLFGYDVHE